MWPSFVCCPTFKKKSNVVQHFLPFFLCCFYVVQHFLTFFLCCFYVVQHIRFSKIFFNFYKKRLYNICLFFSFWHNIWISKWWRGGSGGRKNVGGWCKMFSIKPNYDNKLFGDLRKLNILCTKIVPRYHRVDNLCAILRKSSKQFHVMFWINWQKSYG